MDGDGRHPLSKITLMTFLYIFFLCTCSISLITDRTVGTGTGNLKYKINIVGVCIILHCITPIKKYEKYLRQMQVYKIVLPLFSFQFTRWIKLDCPK